MRISRLIIFCTLLGNFGFSPIAMTQETNENNMLGTQVTISPESLIMPQLEEAYTLNIPFFQPAPSLPAEYWGVTQTEIDYLFEQSPDYLGIAGVDRFKKVNKKFQEATGWSERELISNPFEFFEHPDTIKKNMEYVKFAVKRLSTFGFESHTRCKDNSYIWIQWLTLAKRGVPSESEKDRSYFCIGRDITKQKEQEAARLKALEDHQKELEDHQKELEDRQKEIQSLNQSSQNQNKILRALAEIQAAYIEKEPPPSQENRLEEDIFSAYYKIFELIIDHFVQLTESEYGFIGQIFHDENHQLFTRQIFAGKAKNLIIDNQLQQIINKYRGIGRRFCVLANNILGEVISTKNALIINDIQNYSNITGIPDNHIPINSYLGIPLVLNREVLGIVALANRNPSYNKEIIEWLEPLSLLAARIMQDAKKDYWSKEAKRQSRARAHAEESNKAKSAFLAHMSHEIRTPLTGILGLMDLINKDSLSTEDSSYLQAAQAAGWSLMSLLSDILDISKIEANQITLEKIEFDPIKTAQEIIDLLFIEAQKQKTSLTLTINPGVPHALIGDPTRLRQIFFNLIGNAIKFTKSGAVSVTIDGHENPEAKNLFQLEGAVADTGIGMKPETLQRLFQPFSQADSSVMRQFGGTGLGLYITKKLCELMHGDITVSSQFKVGSTFKFTVKMELPEKKALAPELSMKAEKLEKLPKLNILVAEDNTTNQTVLTTILNREGCTTTVVANGLEAIEAAQRESYDVILMDGEMAEMDGLEATRRIRQLDNYRTTPIIGVTAHALDTHREKFLAAGMDGYLTKPLKRVALTAEILRCLEKKK